MAEKQKQKKKTRYEIKRTVGGKVRHFYGSSPREANQKYLEAVVEYNNTKDNGEPFEDVADAFWKKKEQSIKYGSRRSYQKKVNDAKEWFSGYGMKEITASMVNRELSRMALQGKSYKTIATQKSVLSMIWRYWCTEMGGDSNPVDLLRLPSGLPQKKRRPPSEEEVETVKQNTDGFGLFPNIMIYTGMRLSELCALQRKDIDMKRRVIHITKECVWHGNRPELDTPKTENGVRDIPVLDPLFSLLDGRLDDLDPDDYLFGGETMMTKRCYENAWEQYTMSIGLATRSGQKYKTGKKDKAGNPLYKSKIEPFFTAHQLRHAFASVLVECEIPEPVAKEILGHSDITTTHRWYTDVKSRQIDSAADIMNQFFRKESASEKS